MKGKSKNSSNSLTAKGRSDEIALKKLLNSGTNIISNGNVKMIHEMNETYRDTIKVLKDELKTKANILHVYRLTMLELYQSLDVKTVGRLSAIYLKHATEIYGSVIIKRKK